MLVFVAFVGAKRVAEPSEVLEWAGSVRGRCRGRMKWDEVALIRHLHPKRRPRIGLAVGPNAPAMRLHNRFGNG